MIRRLVAAGTALALLAVTACSGEDEPVPQGDVAADGVLGALNRIQSTKESRQYFSYGDLDAIRKLSEADRDRFQMLVGRGLEQLFTHTERIREGIDLDVLAQQEAVTAGMPPTYVGYVRGDYDVAAVESQLADREIQRVKRGDATTWRAAGDGEIDLADGPFAGIVQTAEFNNIQTEPGRFSYAPTTAALAWATAPGSATLAKDPGMADMAECLGDVVAAIIARTPEDTTTVTAVGVRADGPSQVTDVLCIGTVEASVVSVRQSLEAIVQDESDQRGEPLRDARVNSTDTTVQLLRNANERPGGIFRQLIDGTVFALVRDVLG